jgi:hypothetical protein
VGAAAAAVVAVVLACAAPVHAETCTGTTDDGEHFPICFDPGNRLSITGGTNGIGGAIAIRHVIRFADEPELVWKLEHVVADAAYAGFEDRLAGTLYRGRFLRHTDDGKILLPFGNRKVFLPFDIGALAEIGTLRWRPGDTLARLGVVETAALIDLARSRSFRTRIAFGPAGRWAVDVDRMSWKAVEHIVAPFTLGRVELKLESASGITVIGLDIEAGTAWHGNTGWKPEAIAEAKLERIVLAINDRPIALVLGARYATEDADFTATLGARFTLVDARDPRVR